MGKSVGGGGLLELVASVRVRDEKRTSSEGACVSVTRARAMMLAPGGPRLPPTVHDGHAA